LSLVCDEADVVNGEG